MVLLLLFLHGRISSRSQWPRGLRRRSAAARLLRSWVRIPPKAWMFVCCECYVLSGRGLCDELITRPEESYRLWCVVECDLETSRMRRPWPALGRSASGKKRVKYPGNDVGLSPWDAGDYSDIRHDPFRPTMQLTNESRTFCVLKPGGGRMQRLHCNVVIIFQIRHGFVIRNEQPCDIMFVIMCVWRHVFSVILAT